MQGSAAEATDNCKRACN